METIGDREENEKEKKIESKEANEQDTAGKDEKEETLGKNKIQISPSRVKSRMALETSFV